MERQVRKYAKYKSDMKVMLVASGVWPNFEKHPRALRQFLVICSTFASGFTLYCIVAFMIKYATDLKIFTGCLGLIIAFFSTFIKIVILARCEDDLQSLNDGISARFEDDLQVPENRPHLLANFPTFSRFFYLYSYAVGISVVFLASTPLSMIRHGKYVRMYPQLMPFTYEPGGATHWSVYGFEMLCGFYLWSVTCGVDSVFGLYTLHMVGELRLLGARFQYLHSSENYDKDLKECINRHLLLMESRLKLQRVFGFLAIWLAVTCAIALCALVFQLNTQSNLCLNSIYNSQWPGCGDTRFMNDVLIVLSQKPLMFKAKSWMGIQLDMFSKILHTSVSYFFLLQTLEEKPNALA